MKNATRKPARPARKPAPSKGRKPARKPAPSKGRVYTPDECIARLRVFVNVGGAQRAYSLGVMLGTLTVAQLVEVCDTMHVGGSYASLRRMGKGKLVAHIVADCTPVSA